MRNWTPEQTQAIQARGASFLVSAAAGSGKTSVLVERLIRLLSDSEHRIPAERMAVVTFTNASAAEMKQRLYAALSACIEAEPDNLWLRKQQSMLQCARITTITSFCFSLIREHCEALAITPTFRILEETEAQLMLQDAVSKALLEAYESPELVPAMERLCRVFCPQTDKPLEEMLLSLYRCVMSMPFGLEGMTALSKRYTDGTFEALYLPMLRARLRRCALFSQNALHAAEFVGQEKLSLLLACESEAISAVLAAWEQPDTDPRDCLAMLSSIPFATFPRMGKDCPAPDKRDFAKQLRDSYKKEVQSVLADLSAFCTYGKEDLQSHAVLLPDLQALLQRVDAQLWTAKCDKNAIGFSDAERLALSLLCERAPDGTLAKTELARTLSDYYEILMIDEFQDTNDIQNLIFRLLSRDGTPEQNGSNLFVVGDVKQAIYRFRLANPQIFLDTMQAGVPYTDTTQENATIRLNRNFRSCAQVIAFVNHLFGSLMTEEVGQIAYTTEEALVQGASFADTPRDTEICLVTDDAGESECPMAEYTAKRIAQMIREQHPVSIDGGKSTRPCTPRDFFILMRSTKAKAAAYRDALEAQGISAYAEEQSSYLKSREISLLLNILRIVDNPPLDTAMLSVLLSPMFLFTMEEVTALRLLAPKTSLYGAICTGLGKNAEEGAVLLEGVLLQKTQHFYDTLCALRMHAVSDTLEQLIRRIYDCTDFLAVMRQYQDGQRKKANLRMLLTHARNFETANGGGVSGFLRYIAQILAQGKDVQSGAATAGSENVVTIRTIHKSKGLEYPFLFLVETETRFNFREDAPQYTFHPDYGFGFCLLDPERLTKAKTFPMTAIQLQNRAEAVSEEMRLLYVALTRAKDRLFVPLRLDDKRKARAQALAAQLAAAPGHPETVSADAACMADWIWSALLTLPNAAPLRARAEVETMDEMLCDVADVPLCFADFSASADESTAEAQTDAPSVQADPALVQRLLARFADASVSEQQPAKTSVSALAKDDEMLNLALRRPRFVEEQTKLTPSERGTALHAYLQYADFAKAAQDPHAEAQRLVSHGYLTRAQADSIRMEALEAFFTSPLYARIGRAKAVYREQKFLIRLGELTLPDALQKLHPDPDTMLTGIMDLVLLEEDGLVLVDYKTDAVTDETLLTERYTQQLALYRSTLCALYELPVRETILYAFHLNRAVSLFEGEDQPLPFSSRL